MRIDNFISKISKYGIMRNHRWTVFIGRTGFDNDRLSTMCAGVTLPGRGFEFNEIRTYGPGRNMASSQTYGDEFKMEFLCGNDMYEKQVFSNWMDQMVNPITNNVEYYTNYITDVVVKMYDTQNNLRYAVKLYEVYPTGFESSELVNAGDDPWMKVAINFNYRKFVNLQSNEAIASGQESNIEEPQESASPKSAPPPPPPPQEPATVNNPTVENPRGGTRISYKLPPGEYTSNDPTLSQEEMKNRMDAKKAAMKERRRQRRQNR